MKETRAREDAGCTYKRLGSGKGRKGCQGREKGMEGVIQVCIPSKREYLSFMGLTVQGEQYVM